MAQCIDTVGNTRANFEKSKKRKSKSRKSDPRQTMREGGRRGAGRQSRVNKRMVGVGGHQPGCGGAGGSRIETSNEARGPPSCKEELSRHGTSPRIGTFAVSCEHKGCTNGWGEEQPGSSCKDPHAERAAMPESAAPSLRPLGTTPHGEVGHHGISIAPRGPPPARFRAGMADGVRCQAEGLQGVMPVATPHTRRICRGGQVGGKSKRSRFARREKEPGFGICTARAFDSAATFAQITHPGSVRSRAAHDISKKGPGRG
jgi:hypothetical protein